MVKNIRFEEWEEKQMQDPEFRAAAEELEPAYQITRLRIMRGYTQKQLAELVGTKQSSIARLESGKRQPRLSFLKCIVEALGGHLEVTIMPSEEMINSQLALYDSFNLEPEVGIVTEEVQASLSPSKPVERYHGPIDDNNPKSKSQLDQVRR